MDDRVEIEKLFPKSTGIMYFYIYINGISLEVNPAYMVKLNNRKPLIPCVCMTSSLTGFVTRIVDRKGIKNFSSHVAATQYLYESNS